jgi:hypothetical protein
MLDHKILNRGSNGSYRVLVVNMKKVNVFSIPTPVENFV